MWECKRQFGAASVRIGLMGEGRAPNYRIEYARASSSWSNSPLVFAVYNGLSHKKIEDLGQIDLDLLFGKQTSGEPKNPFPDRHLHYDHWSSRSMSLDEVAALLGKL